MSSSSDSASPLAPLSECSPFLIAGNVRLRHRCPSASQVNAWISRARVFGGSATGFDGDLVLGELQPESGRTCRVRDHTGTVHVLTPPDEHDAQRPHSVRVVATLGTCDSLTHANGGLVDGASGSLTLTAGRTLAWLGEESGVIGQIIDDAIDDAEASGTSSSTRSIPFVVIGLLQDSDTGKTINIRSLCPTIPPTATPQRTANSTPTPPPRLILVGATSSSMGQTDLACSVILALHAARAASREPPRVAYAKLTGVGSLKDTLHVQSLRTADGRPAVVRCFDHVDAGLITTYSPPRAAGFVDRLKSCVSDLLTLAAAPVPVYLPRVGGIPIATSAPIDYVVCELGGDLIWAGNPVILHLHHVVDRLSALFVLTQDALSILGACSYLHGTLKLPPSKLVLVNSPRVNYTGMCARMRGSDVQLYAQSDITQVVADLVTRDAQTATAPAEATEAALQLQWPSQAARSPVVDESEPANGHALTNVPTNGFQTTPVAPAIPSPAEADIHYDLSLPLLTLPPWVDPDPSAETSSCCERLVEWVMSSADLDLPYADVEVAWTELDVTTLVLSVSREPRLQESLNYQFMQRKRDRLRESRSKAEEEHRAAQFSLSLGALADAKSGESKTAMAVPLSPLTDSARALLALGDYSTSPYFLAAAPDSPETLDALAAGLLDFDASLAWLRRSFVPARVSESIFWPTYFGALRSRLQEHARRKQRDTAIRRDMERRVEPSP